MEPSKEAIEAVWNLSMESGGYLEDGVSRHEVAAMLKAAYAIDFAALQQQLADSQREVERLKQRLDDVNVKDSVKTREINLLVDEDHKLRTLLRELAEALKDQIPTYTNPASQCWCPNYLLLEDGAHSLKLKGIEQANNVIELQGKTIEAYKKAATKTRLRKVLEFGGRAGITIGLAYLGAKAGSR